MYGGRYVVGLYWNISPCDYLRLENIMSYVYLETPALVIIKEDIMSSVSIALAHLFLVIINYK